jgi:hypothetical protein
LYWILKHCIVAIITTKAKLILLASNIYYAKNHHPIISLLSTKLLLSSPLHRAPTFTVMDSYGSQRLVALAQQLRFYKPPSPSPDEIEEQNIEESAGKVVSQVGFQESATSIFKDPERFRPKRAAVLVCIFEGDAGEFRVILTKRSSRLSTHSGLWIFFLKRIGVFECCLLADFF